MSDEKPKPHCCVIGCLTAPTHSVHHLEPKESDEYYEDTHACRVHVGELLPKGPAAVHPLEC